MKYNVLKRTYDKNIGLHNSDFEVSWEQVKAEGVETNTFLILALISKVERVKYTPTAQSTPICDCTIYVSTIDYTMHPLRHNNLEKNLHVAIQCQIDSIYDHRFLAINRVQGQKWWKESHHVRIVLEIDQMEMRCQFQPSLSQLRISSPKMRNQSRPHSPNFILSLVKMVSTSNSK